MLQVERVREGSVVSPTRGRGRDGDDPRVTARRPAVSLVGVGSPGGNRDGGFKLWPVSDVLVSKPDQSITGRVRTWSGSVSCIRWVVSVVYTCRWTRVGPTDRSEAER